MSEIAVRDLCGYGTARRMALDESFKTDGAAWHCRLCKKKHAYDDYIDWDKILIDDDLGALIRQLPQEIKNHIVDFLPPGLISVDKQAWIRAHIVSHESKEIDASPYSELGWNQARYRTSDVVNRAALRFSLDENLLDAILTTVKAKMGFNITSGQIATALRHAINETRLPNRIGYGKNSKQYAQHALQYMGALQEDLATKAHSGTESDPITIE